MSAPLARQLYSVRILRDVERPPSPRNRTHFAAFWSGLALTIWVALDAHCQTPDAFNLAATGTIQCMAIQPDGNVLVGGSFIALGGVARTSLGRLFNDGTLDPTFNPVADWYVGALAVQSDSKILVAGFFTQLAGQPRRYIGRLYPDGSLDPTFNPGASSLVSCLAVQENGQILIGGQFSQVAGHDCQGIARLNEDGTLDTTFTAQAGGSYPIVYSLAIQRDGKILVGGSFTALTGFPRNFIGRLNPDGSVDPDFNPGANGMVNVFAVQPDGSIVVAGSFSALGGQSAWNIGRLNSAGVFDATFTPKPNGNVFTLATQADGRILLGGYFTQLGNEPCAYIGRLNTDGTPDTGFNATVGNGTNWPAINSLAIQPDGKVLVGGEFTSLNGRSCRNIGRFTATQPATQDLKVDLDNGTITWLRSGTSPEVWRTIFDVAIDGSTWVSLGDGQPINGGWEWHGATIPSGATIRARGFVAGSYGSGSAWFAETAIGPPAITSQPASRTNNAGTGAGFVVQAAGTPPLTYKWAKDGLALEETNGITGTHTSILCLSNILGASAGAYSVVVSNAEGSVTSAVATLTVVDPYITAQPLSPNTGAGQTVTLQVLVAGTEPIKYQWRKNGIELPQGTGALLTLPDVTPADQGNYDVVVTNTFGSATSQVAVVTLTATTDSFNPNANNRVLALAVQADGKVLVGGNFTQIAGQTCRGLARVNSDGSFDTSFNSGVTGSVYCVALEPDSKMIVGGTFSAPGGQLPICIGRLNSDGSADDVFNTTANGRVNCLAIQPDGKILLGGSFSSLCQQSRNFLGRLNRDGTLDPTFAPKIVYSGISPPGIYAMALQPDGKIIVGGAISSLGGQTRNYLGRLNSDGSVDTAFNPGANNIVECFAFEANGRLLVGGEFTTLAGQTCTNIGRLTLEGNLDTSFNPRANKGVWAIALQTDGKILAAGNFSTLGGIARTNIGRLNPDGTLDTSFSVQVTPRTPVVFPSINALAIQSDGRILVGGWLASLAGQLRNGIGRLMNTDIATESLSFDGSSITWMRGGTGPEISFATFDFSVNGIDWTAVGGGVRVPGGWRVEDISLPINGIVRARGCVNGGNYGGSAWFVQNLSAPVIITPDRMTAFRLNQFGFNVEGPSDTQIIIEASPDLRSWTLLATNLFQTSSFYFCDPNTTNFSSRFYRARVTRQQGSPPFSVAQIRPGPTTAVLAPRKQSTEFRHADCEPHLFCGVPGHCPNPRIAGIR
jgi:uncharacterized delta-60 repeat protein